MPQICNTNTRSILCLWLMCGLLFGCATSTTNVTQPKALTPTSSTLPSFNDWRVAYLDPTGTFQIVSLNARTTLSGHYFGFNQHNGLHLGSAGISPNGRTFATTDSQVGVTVAPIFSPMPTNADGFQRFQQAPYDLRWSPDSQSIAASDNVGDMWITPLLSKQTRQILNSPQRMISDLIGWIDSDHLAVGGRTDPQHYVLYRLDITSGTLHPIATISSSGLSIVNCWISPDGKQVILGNRQFRADPYIPELDVIDTSSGAVTTLPTIAKHMGGDFTSAAWRPGSRQFAITAGFIANGKVQTSLIDLTTNTIVQLTDRYYVVAWVPDGSTAILSTGLDSDNAIGFGPYTIASLPVGSDGTAGPLITLTTQATSFNIVGLVRNPA